MMSICKRLALSRLGFLIPLVVAASACSAGPGGRSAGDNFNNAALTVTGYGDDGIVASFKEKGGKLYVLIFSE